MNVINNMLVKNPEINIYLSIYLFWAILDERLGDEPFFKQNSFVVGGSPIRVSPNGGRPFLGAEKVVVVILAA